MAITRAVPSRLAFSLCGSLPTTALRLASTAAQNRGGKSNSRGRAKTYVMMEDKRFFRGGKLFTTPENSNFLLRHDIEPDNGLMTRLNGGPELRDLGLKFPASFFFSPKHILHPFDIRYFDPKGHPLAAMKRTKYARKVRDEPLWIIFTSITCDASPVVRVLTQRRLVRAVHMALKARGYDSAPGKGPRKEIRGTLWVTIYNPVSAAAQSAQLLGETLAAALERTCSRWSA